jgi:hypothetical protein
MRHRQAHRRDEVLPRLNRLFRHRVIVMPCTAQAEALMNEARAVTALGDVAERAVPASVCADGNGIERRISCGKRRGPQQLLAQRRARTAPAANGAPAAQESPARADRLRRRVPRRQHHQGQAGREDRSRPTYEVSERRPSVHHPQEPAKRLRRAVHLARQRRRRRPQEDPARRGPRAAPVSPAGLEPLAKSAKSWTKHSAKSSCDSNEKRSSAGAGSRAR